MNNLKSLSSLKKQREQEEDAFTHLRKSHSHLSRLTDVEILQFFELDKREEIVGYKIVSQKVSSLSDKNTSEMVCLCKDSKGNGKFLYITYSEARQKSIFLQKEQQIKLKVYACPSTDGWHLSKL